MKNKYNRNGLTYFLVVIVTIIVYLVIQVYYNGIKEDIYQCNAGYTGNNNIYTVKTGDSLEKIAEMYNIPIERLKEYNNITGNELKPGQQILIPNDDDSSNKQPVNNIITTKDEIKITKINLNTNKITMTVGSKEKLYVTVEPYDASRDDLVWESSNPSIATVDSNGNIVALKEGTVTITVKTKDGSVSESCTVVVKPVKVDKIILNPTSLSVKVGASAPIVSVIKPDNATVDELIWTTSDPSIAKVDNNGRVTGVKEGTATITAKTPDGKVTATCVVNVVSDVVPVTGIKVNPTSTSIDIGSSSQLLVTLEPANTTERDVIFSTSDPSIVTVDSTGKITGVGIGTATVTIKTKDGKYETTCTVTVNPIKAEQILLNTNDLSIGLGKTGQLEATIIPENTTDKELIWTSSDPTIATVDSTGKVTGEKVGEVTITVKTKDGKVKAECHVTVEDTFDDRIKFVYDYDEGNYIYLINQFPIRDEVGKNLQGVKHTQDFKLKFNERAKGVRYVITAEKLDGSDLKEEWTKLFLVNDGADVANCYRTSGRIKTFNEYAKYNGNNKEVILYEGVVSNAEATRGYKDFTFRMWVSEDLQVTNSDYLSESKTFKTRINVYAVGD